MRYFCIGDEDTVLGFQLAGVDGQLVRNSVDTRSAFALAIATPDVGIIIITEKLADTIRQDIDKFEASSDLPLILELPDRSGPPSSRKSLAQLVRQAVGVKV